MRSRQILGLDWIWMRSWLAVSARGCGSCIREFLDLTNERKFIRCQRPLSSPSILLFILLFILLSSPLCIKPRTEPPDRGTQEADEAGRRAHLIRPDCQISATEQGPPVAGEWCRLGIDCTRHTVYWLMLKHFFTNRIYQRYAASQASTPPPSPTPWMKTVKSLSPRISIYQQGH